MADDLYMDTSAAALVLGVTRRRVLAMIQAGRLPAVRRDGRDWLIERAVVLEYAAAPRRRGGRPRRDAPAVRPSVEVAFTRDALHAARVAAMRGVPYVADGGALLSPQVIAYAAGLVEGGARSGVYTPDDGVAVVVETGGVRVRLV